MVSKSSNSGEDGDKEKKKEELLVLELTNF